MTTTDIITEEKTEQCTIASKRVKVSITRRKEADSSGDGIVTDFHCDNSSDSCESRCTYKMLLNDF